MEKSTFSLRNKLMLSFLIISIVPILCIIYLLYYIQSNLDYALFNQDTYIQLYSISEVTIKVLFIILIISICLAISFSYSLTIGINQLTKRIHEVKSGNYRIKQKVEYNSNDEIMVLTNTFNDMSKELDTLINKTLLLKISERETKLKALQSQISPHFLYNALDSINWNLIESGDFKTSEILVALSSILRYSIDDEKASVKLEEELFQLKNYLKIQKERFSDRFDYEIIRCVDINGFIVPKMILQPIVENAIKHGIRTKKDGFLKIVTYSKDDYVYIEIKDNGVGIEEKKLKELHKNINTAQHTDDDDFHIGLGNVNNRIKYTYGNCSGIYIESIVNEYTNVIVKLRSRRNS